MSFLCPTTEPGNAPGALLGCNEVCDHLWTWACMVWAVHPGLVGDHEPWVRVPALTPPCLQALSRGPSPSPGPSPPLLPCCWALSFFFFSRIHINCFSVAKLPAIPLSVNPAARHPGIPPCLLPPLLLAPASRAPSPGAVPIPLPPDPSAGGGEGTCVWNTAPAPSLADGIRHPRVLGEGEPPGHAAPGGAGGVLAHPSCPKSAHRWAKWVCSVRRDGASLLHPQCKG